MLQRILIMDVGFYLRLNHGNIITAILDHAGVPIEKRKPCCLVIQQLFAKQNWKLTKAQLVNQVQLSASTVKTLETFCTLKGSLDHVTHELNVIAQNHPGVTEALKDLSKLSTLLKALGVRVRLSFEPGLVYNYHYYQTGFLFQVLILSKRVDILAAGGRYDSLVMQYRHPSAYGQKMRAVGVNIALGKIAAAIELDPALKNTRGGGSADAKHDMKGSTMFARSLVYVASFGRIPLEDRLAMCTQLWRHDISAEYMTEDSPNTIEDLQKYCRDYNIQWLVILKEHGRWGANTVKIRNIVLHKQETDMRREEVADYILAQISEHGGKLELGAGIGKPVRRERTISSSSTDLHTSDSALYTGSLPNFGIHAVVLNPPRLANKMKASKKQLISDKALKSVAPFVEALSGSASSSAKPGSTALLAHSPSTSTQPQSKMEILALDLRVPVLRRLIECHDVFDEDVFRKEVLDYHPQQKDYLQAIRAHLSDLRKSKGTALKWIFLYSHLEDRWELLQL